MEIERLKAGTFMGETHKIRSLAGFTLSKTVHAQHLQTPKHEHENPYVSLLLNGVYHEESIVSEYDVTSGVSLFRPKGFEHQNEIGTQHSFCFNIEIQKELSHQSHYSNISDHIEFERNNLEVQKIFYAFQNDFSDELLTLNVEENLYHLFRHHRRENLQGRAPWVEGIKREIRLHPERMYRIDEVSEMLHIHPNYFVRKFKEKSGFTFGDFLLRQRISRGIDLMLNSSKNLTEIANESGFYDQSHFIRHFKRAFGTTPSHYRKIVKG